MANQTQKLIKRLRRRAIVEFRKEEERKSIEKTRYLSARVSISLALASTDFLLAFTLFAVARIFEPFSMTILVLCVSVTLLLSSDVFFRFFGPEIKEPDQLLPSRLLRNFYTEQIDAIEEKVIGSGSKFQRQLEIIRKHRRQALVIEGRAKQRFEKSGALYLKEVIDKMQEIVDQALKTERTLEEFKKKIQAFTAEAQVVIGSQINESLDDVGLLQEANALTAEVQIDESEAWRVMSETLDTLDQQLSALRHETTHLFDRRLTMETIVALVNPTDPLRQIAIIEDAAARFQPPKIENVVH